MMGRATFCLVLLVSCAHALVHVYEISLPSVELKIADEYFGDDPAAGKRMTGWLSNSWRLMWGMGAIVAGWLVDRYGSRRLLAVYLLGCASTCALAAASFSRGTLFPAMILMGAFASIYHPAGLALISHETGPVNRPRALGIHGILGSAGIGSTPLLVGLLLAAGFTWRQIYWVLLVPGAALGLVFLWQAIRVESIAANPSGSHGAGQQRDGADWRSFFLLTAFASLQGFIYSALMSFLPRYLSHGGMQLPSVPQASTGNFLAAGVLLVGCLGQALAGRLARPALLERQLTWITFGNVPFLLWMAWAAAWDRALAAGLLALVHFMNQPIYNSLVAKYTPRSRRSLCYGFSFAMAFGIGSFGAGFAGISQSDSFVYGTLALVATASGLIGVTLWPPRAGRSMS